MDCTTKLIIMKLQIAGADNVSQIDYI